MQWWIYIDRCPAHAPLRVQILSFWHTKFLKRNRLGSPCSPYEVHAPLWEILDPPLSSAIDERIPQVAYRGVRKNSDILSKILIHKEFVIFVWNCTFNQKWQIQTKWTGFFGWIFSKYFAAESSRFLICAKLSELNKAIQLLKGSSWRRECVFRYVRNVDFSLIVIIETCKEV